MILRFKFFSIVDIGKAIHNHLGKMAALPNFLNGDLSRGFTVAQVAQKHGWKDPMGVESY